MVDPDIVNVPPPGVCTRHTIAFKRLFFSELQSGENEMSEGAGGPRRVYAFPEAGSNPFVYTEEAVPTGNNILAIAPGRSRIKEGQRLWPSLIRR
jgi:hypothetical protein